MNSRLFSLSSLALCTAAWATLQSGSLKFVTPQGTWDLTQIGSMNFKTPDKDHGHFFLKGKPVQAVFNKGERILKAPEVEGEVKREGKTWTPVRIDFRGGVMGHQSQGAKTVDVTSDNATLLGEAGQNTINLNGNVRIVQRDPDKGSTLVATGSKGSVVAREKTGNTGTLDGPVHLNLKGVSKDGSPINMDGTCESMTFDLTEAPYKIVMRGNVIFQGGQSGFQGETRASRMTVLLDKDYQPIEMQGDGEPGTTNVQRESLRGSGSGKGGSGN